MQWLIPSCIVLTLRMSLYWVSLHREFAVEHSCRVSRRACMQLRSRQAFRACNLFSYGLYSVRNSRLPLSTEAPVIMPNDIDFSVSFLILCSVQLLTALHAKRYMDMLHWNSCSSWLYMWCCAEQDLMHWYACSLFSTSRRHIVQSGGGCLATAALWPWSLDDGACRAGVDALTQLLFVLNFLVCLYIQRVTLPA